MAFYARDCPAGRRAQSALEFVALFGVALAFFIIFYAYLANERLLTADGYGALEARSAARHVASLLTAAGVSKGYYQEFSVPYTVGGGAYNLTVANDTVWVDWRGGSFAAGFSAGPVRGPSSAAPFAVGAGNHFINNTAGTVWVV